MIIKKKRPLRIIAILFVVIAILSASGYFLFVTKGKVSYDIFRWNRLQMNIECLPSVEGMGNYEDIYFKHYNKKYGLIFESDAYTLKASYSEEEYEKQKEIILEKYLFSERVGVVLNPDDEKEASFTLDSFDFKILSEREYELYYPQNIVFVGTSEEKNEIVFIYYSDIDLDYISETFQEFLVYDCGWE